MDFYVDLPKAGSIFPFSRIKSLYEKSMTAYCKVTIGLQIYEYLSDCERIVNYKSYHVSQHFSDRSKSLNLVLFDYPSILFSIYSFPTHESFECLKQAVK